MLKLPMLLIALLMTTSCAAQQTQNPLTVSGATDSFCLVSGGPILWSKNDTEATIEQVKKYNAKGAAICNWKP
jgi:hypothetical protein